MKDPYKLLGVTGIWSIEKDSGLPLIYHETESKIEGTLFGGLLTAIRSMLSEIQIGQLSSIATDIYDLIITTSEHIVTAIALEKGYSSECLYPLLSTINKKVEEIYLDKVKKGAIIDTELFTSFSKTLPELLSSYTTNLIQSCSTNDIEDEPEKVDDPNKKLKDSGLW